MRTKLIANEPFVLEREGSEKDLMADNIVATVGEEVKIGILIENGVNYEVYRKVIDFGQLPNTASQVTVGHGISTATIHRVLSVSGVASASNFSTNMPLPLSTTGASAAENNIYLSMGASKITIGVGKDRSTLSALVMIDYARVNP